MRAKIHFIDGALTLYVTEKCQKIQFHRLITWQNPVKVKRNTPKSIIFHAIKPVVGNNSSAIRNVRREDVVITRLRLGHSRFTHSYILNREEQPFCIVCNQHITVKHILTDCIDFLQDRNKYFQVRDLRQLFQDVPVDNILSFLKDTNLFNKI